MPQAGLHQGRVATTASAQSPSKQRHTHANHTKSPPCCLALHPSFLKYIHTTFQTSKISHFAPSLWLLFPILCLLSWVFRTLSSHQTSALSSGSQRHDTHGPRQKWECALRLSRLLCPHLIGDCWCARESAEPPWCTFPLPIPSRYLCSTSAGIIPHH